MRANCVQIQPEVEGNLTDMCGTGGGLQAVARYGVDVISAVEDAAHRKSRPRVRAFIQAAKGMPPTGAPS